MGTADHFVLGDYNAACHECGRKRKSSQLRKHWRGYYVCPEHWEPRHPQDFAGPAPAESRPAWTQPQSDTFVENGIPAADPYVPPGWDDPTS